MALLDRIENSSAEVILSIALILFAGFLMTRITKKLHLPDVTGYILAGGLIGPYVLNLISTDIMEGMGFITDIALAYIAFGVGKYFKLEELKKNGKRIIIITVFEALLAGTVVALTMIFLFHLSVPFAILLGAIGSATAPASTIMTINQYHARGELVNTILQVVALDDAVALIAFSVCAAIADQLESGAVHMRWNVFLVPLLVNLLVLFLGAVCGYLLKWIISDSRSRDHRLILINAVIFAMTGVCTMLDVSPLLPCMVMGTVYVNVIEKKNLFKQVNHFSPPIMLMFFVLSGMRLNVPMLVSAGVIGVVYFGVRILGKYAGAWMGSLIGKASPEVRKYLGLALVPQAGVAIGLAALGQRILPPQMGTMLSTIILSSSILYEMVGPACAKGALILAHEIRTTKAADTGRK
ncbi:cation:proton antiporter [Diplocloster agilis]|uniref:Cation:proton antiporter n=1 Tax=Diplocloster agilis TaxID=2850323 RepID=A0A949N9K3_9FIRM|nr:cation:proton antiporter [Diplocloster agilis]MBU9735467.1 cation:proton antiporter [Diplocloster agilis]